MNKYNVIWIVIDGIRNYATNVDELGKLKIMDEMEKESVYFHNVITSSPSTIMALSAMMTSLPAYYIGRDYDSFKYDKNSFTPFTEILKNNGYGIYGILCWRDLREKLSNIFGDTLRRYWQKGLKHEKENWLNEDINNIFFNFLNERPPSPFFLYVHYLGRKEDDTSAQIRQVTERLKKEGLYDTSIFIMCSDHGFPDLTRGRTEKECFDMKDTTHDLVMTDDNILIPFYLRYPGSPIIRIETVVSSLDIMPTLLDVIGIENPVTEGSMHGKSLLPLIQGKAIELENRKIRVDGRFLMQAQRRTALRNNKYKYLIYHDSGQEEFYDIIKDPYEKHNLMNLKEYSGIIDEFRQEFKKQEEVSVKFHFKYLLEKMKKTLSSMRDINERQVLIISYCKFKNELLLIKAITEIFENSTLDLIISKPSNDENYELPPAVRNAYYFEGDFPDFSKLASVYPRLKNKNYDFVIVPSNNLASENHKKIVKSARHFSKNRIIPIDINMDVDYRSGRRWYYPFKVLYARRKYYLAEPVLLFKDILHFMKSLLKQTPV